MKKIIFQKNSKQKGYTIIETMIAVSLFVIVITIGMGALLNANLLHQKSQSTLSIMDNLSFIMEDMSRNLRTGSNYYCITGIGGIPSPLNIPHSGQPCWGIAFEPSGGNPASSPSDQWVYYIDNTGKIFKATAGPYAQANFIQLNPDEVTIDPVASGFSVLGAESPSVGNKQQAFVTIRLIGTITFKNVITPFSLQTSVSQRLIDI